MKITQVGVEPKTDYLAHWGSTKGSVFSDVVVNLISSGAIDIAGVRQGPGRAEH